MECIYLPRDAGPSWLLVALGAFVVAALSFCMLIQELIAPLELSRTCRRLQRSSAANAGRCAF